MRASWRPKVAADYQGWLTEVPWLVWFGSRRTVRSRQKSDLHSPAPSQGTSLFALLRAGWCPPLEAAPDKRLSLISKPKGQPVFQRLLLPVMSWSLATRHAKKPVEAERRCWSAWSHRGRCGLPLRGCEVPSPPQGSAPRCPQPHAGAAGSG